MEIQGYGIEGLLRSSTRDNLYLAVREGGQERFVVRVFESDTDPHARLDHLKRLQQSRVLHHRGLCEIVDVGRCEKGVYLVMPFYEGGNLSEVLARGLGMPRLLQIANDICDAMHVLHRQGMAHGDIKPSNVVFDGVGSTVLVDGGYLNPQDSNISFTPGYGAPELTRGERPNAHSDIFSLGMLLFRVLSGDLPWLADKSGIPRTRDATDTLPSLGPQHVALGNVVETMVAFKPEQRFDSALQVKESLVRLTGVGDLRTVAVKSDLITTAEINAVLPSLGSTDGVANEMTLASGLRSVVHWVVVLSVVGAGLWGVAMRAIEFPASQRVLADFGLADNPALVEARLNAEALVADPNQNLQSIVAAYEAVLAYEPDDQEAIDAISDARAEWLADFETALAQNELNAAQNRLNDLLAIYPEDADLLVLFDRLQVRKHAVRLTSDTVALLNITGFESDASAEMALHAFREVLRLYPASPQAVRELDKLAAHYSETAASEVELGNIQSAMDNLNKAGLANPSFGGLASVREQIQRATTLREEIAARISEANGLQRTGQLIDPPGRNAAMLYHSVLTTDPDNEEALRGLGDVSSSIVEQFQMHLVAREFSTNRHIIERAKAVGLYPASIMHMETAMANELETISRVADLLLQAEQLIADGYITEPTGENAVGVLREAKRLDDSNARIDELIERCVDRLATVAQDAQSFGMEDVAMTYASLAEQVRQNTNL